jgi:phosphoribosyl 1,2-cyclic phosphodiesterase
VRVAVLGSGSRGNAIVVEFGITRILVDAGFGPRILTKRCRSAGLRPETISACVVTHEHIDHARGVRQAQRRWGWTVVSTRPTLDAVGVKLPSTRVCAARHREPVTIGDVRITLLPITHDAVSPSAVLVEHTPSGARVGVAHDLGAIPDDLPAAFERLDILVLEANHDVGLLRTGPYPPFLQDRILGRNGHLSNPQAARFAADVAHKDMRAMVLAHLREHNNPPQIARAAVARALRASPFRGQLVTAAQDAACAVGDRQDDQLRLL